MFNLYGKVIEEIAEFEKPIDIVPKSKSAKGYKFSQIETVNLIDLYSASQFESGEFDSEGMKKLFLNVGNFRCEVASKQVDLDVKNFVFTPEDDNEMAANLMQKDFRLWAKDTYFGELINEVIDALPKYGTVVLKKVKDKLEFTPLQVLRNDQKAKSLDKSPYVIEIHEDMTVEDMRSFKDWDLSKLNMEFGDTYTVFERYGYVPLDYYNREKGLPVNEEDKKKTIYVVAFICASSNKDNSGHTLFMEKAKLPYQEVHWERVYGRWLGRGEMEKQFENQVARNMIANLRRRALMWSSRKVFQANSELVAQNLIRDVKDGEVLVVGMNNQVTQIDTSTRTLAEFQSAENVWEENSNQKSFTFEVATGEALPSGTPFRLGVVLSNSVNSYFGLKREKIGLFFKRVVIEQLLPEFKRKMSYEHLLSLSKGEEFYNKLLKIKIDYEFNRIAKKKILKGEMVNSAQLREFVTRAIDGFNTQYVNIVKGFYDNVNAKVNLTITGENTDIQKKLETYTNIYNSLSQKGDPRAENVLRKIVGITGDNFDDIVGGADLTGGQGGQMPEKKQESSMDKMVLQSGMQDEQV
jgi:hypothetical protein